MKAMVMLILVTLVLLAPVVAEAQFEKEYVAEVLPAPIGYSLTFQKPYPQYIAGYRDVGGHFHPYRASIGETGVLIYAESNLYIRKLVSGTETGRVRLIKVEDINKAYGINLPSTNDIIVYGGGTVYISHYNIFINTVPEANAPGPILVINEYMVDFSKSKKYSLGLAVPSLTSPITVITKDGLQITTRLSDLLGVSESCVTWFQNPPPGVPWVGGVVMSPTCLKNVGKVYKTFTYEGRPYAVIFSAKTQYGDIDYVILASPTAEVLEMASIISSLRTNPKLHIIKGVTLDNTYIYTAPSPNAMIVRGEILPASDATQIVQVKNETKYVCIMPSNATILYRLLWKNRELRGTVYLLPGETVLFKAGSKYYFCHGDIDWLDNDDMPIVKGPAFKELIHPILIYTISGKKFLVFTSNGKVYSTNNIELPFSVYQGNEIFIYAVHTVRPVIITQTSIFTSPFFILAVLFVGVVVSLVVFGRRKEEPEKIRIILDLPKPKSLSVASKETMQDVVNKHVDNFGVCPDVLDVVLYHNVLPPLPEKLESPFEEVLLCPFKTNEETEHILRRVSGILLYSVWANKRIGKNHGLFYTLIGDTMLYTYWYKREDEPPEEVIVRAVEKAYKTHIKYPYHKLPLGLVILVEDNLVKQVRKELEYIQLLTTAGSELVRGYAISSYVSVKGVRTSVSPDKLQKFVNEKIPTILVISDKNIHELIEYLEERIVSFSELYYRKMRGGMT